MQDKIFQSVVLSIIYLIIKDKNILNLDDLNNAEKKIIDKVFEFIKNEENFIHLPDKKLYLKKVFDEFKEKVFIDGILIESNFFNVLEELTANFDEKKKIEIFDMILKQSISDKFISSGEKEVIYQIAHKLKLPVDDLKKYVQSKLKQFSKRKKDDDIIKVSNPPMIMLALAVVFIGVTVFFAFNIYKSKMFVKNINMSNIVYKKIYFNKFIVAGNAYAGDVKKSNSKTQKWFGKSIVFYIEGSADIEFNLNNFKLVNNKLIYKGNAPEGATEVYPFLIDVNISQSKIEKVFEKQPQEVTPEKTKKLAMGIGLVSAAAGGYIGAKLGSLVGKFIPIGGNKAVSKISGMVAGGVLGGVVSGIAGYIATNKLLTGVQLTKGISLADHAYILSKSKELIAAELFSNEKLMNSLKKDFENYVKNYLNNFGIKIKEISYAVSI